MKNNQPTPTCTRCKSPETVSKCCSELFDESDILLCQECKNWFCDHNKGISRDAKFLALGLIKHGLPVEVMDKMPDEDSKSYYIEFSINEENKPLVIIKPSSIKVETPLPKIIASSLTFRFPNSTRDMTKSADYYTNELILKIQKLQLLTNE